jgi:3-hydroxybutyryl-CoA dehydrogenase
MMIQSVGVIGVGNIGSGVVIDLVLHGIQTVAVEASAERLEHARAEILKGVRFAPLLAKGAPKLKREEALQRFTLTTRLEDVANCGFIIENAFEDWNVKKPIYERLDQIAPKEVCFGVNTSCISITRIAGLTKRPDKVIGIHFMNPVFMMPTVEVIRGQHTSDDTVAVLQQLFVRLKKEAIIVGDLPGFVSNRISHLFMNEAAFVFQDGLATAAQIDAIFKKCFGHKMGPLETADLIGLDTVVRSLQVLFDSFQDPKYRCCPLLKKMVDAGQLGRKSGQGFYAYPDAGS